MKRIGYILMLALNTNVQLVKRVTSLPHYVFLLCLFHLFDSLYVMRMLLC